MIWAWVSIASGTLIAAWLTYDTVRDRCRIGADPVRYLIRLSWYRLSGRMPGKCPQRDLYRLSDEDRGKFGGLMITYRECGEHIPEPRYHRRQS